MEFDRLVLATFGLFLIGCSGSGGGGSEAVGLNSGAVYGACDHREHSDPNQQHCREWTGARFSNIDLSALCQTIDSGVFLRGPCSPLNRIGTCILNEDMELETKFHYYSGQWNQKMAEINCGNKDLTDLTGNTPSAWYPE